MNSIPVSEFKARCLAVLKQVEETREPMAVLRHGREIARILPTPQTPSGKRKLGAGAHLGEALGDIVHVDMSEDWELDRRNLGRA